MDPLLTKEAKSMSAEERAEAQMSTAMASPDHLRQWLDETGRHWLVLNTDELVKALPWPTGVEALQNMLRAYRGFRQSVPTGEMATLACSGATNCQICILNNLKPSKDRHHEVPVFKEEELNVAELDRAIRYLVAQLTARDPSWSLEKPAL